MCCGESSWVHILGRLTHHWNRRPRPNDQTPMPASKNEPTTVRCQRGPRSPWRGFLASTLLLSGVLKRCGHFILFFFRLSGLCRRGLCSGSGDDIPQEAYAYGRAGGDYSDHGFDASARQLGRVVPLVNGLVLAVQRGRSHANRRALPVQMLVSTISVRLPDRLSRTPSQAIISTS